MKDRVAIVILNFKNYLDTINCIRSILKVREDGFLIIVVDNNSQNDSLAKIKLAFKQDMQVKYYDEEISDSAKLILVENRVNNGYAAGNNIGLKLGYNLGCKYLMVLNNDTLFLEDFLSDFSSLIDNSENLLCVGPKLVKSNKVSLDYNCAKRRPTFCDIFRNSYFGNFLKTSKWEEDYFYLKGNPELNFPLKVDIISGSCMFFSAERLKDIDFFDDKTFLYYEEAIIHEKARVKDYIMMLDPRVRMVHLGAQTTKKQSNSLFTLQCEYHSLRYYLKQYRNVGNLMLEILTFSNWLFLKAYSIKSKLR